MSSCNISVRHYDPQPCLLTPETLDPTVPHASCLMCLLCIHLLTPLFLGQNFLLSPTSTFSLSLTQFSTWHNFKSFTSITSSFSLKGHVCSPIPLLYSPHFPFHFLRDPTFIWHHSWTWTRAPKWNTACNILESCCTRSHSGSSRCHVRTTKLGMWLCWTMKATVRKPSCWSQDVQRLMNGSVLSPLNNPGMYCGFVWEDGALRAAILDDDISEWQNTLVVHRWC